MSNILPMLDYLNQANKHKKYKIVKEIKKIRCEPPKIIKCVLFETDDIDEANEKVVSEYKGFCKSKLKKDRYYEYFVANSLVEKIKIIDVESIERKK